ncbi:hypothetical protein D7X55_27555 [Corallococcus sp. AB049A]|uniref:Uncharacterized protein n=2 Tax=Myxococcaceae TaxID=31 RepID=A0A3A8QLK6_9BACT|nr:hypothetical protein D7Y23_36315 [Corallococcus sp. AB050B]RKH69417.1 hypothetical protein D7X96_14845 [Corallococcus interemptor]RKI57689.1 hypothetical protein D7X55_27555 [Corallococcus sp. AB049A]
MAVLIGLVGTLAQAAPPRWSVPRDARIEHLEARMAEGPDRDHCGDFTLSAEETLTYLRLATLIPDVEVHGRVEWVGCVVQGTLVSGKGKQRKEVKFEISATLAARLDAPVNGMRYLVCEGACDAKMTALYEKRARQEQK